MKNEKLIVLLHYNSCCSVESFSTAQYCWSFYLVEAHTGKFLFTELLQKPEHIFVINLEKRFF